MPLRASRPWSRWREGHPLAARERVILVGCWGVPLIVLRRELAPRAYDAALEAAALRTRSRSRAGRSPAEALALAGAGLGVYRVPASAAVAAPGLVYVELEARRARRAAPPPGAAVPRRWPRRARSRMRLFDAPDASNDGGLRPGTSGRGA